MEPRNLTFVLEVEEAEHAAWRVETFRWDEAISAPPRGLFVLSSHRTYDPQKLLGQKARFLIKTHEGARERVFEGVVTAAEVEIVDAFGSSALTVEVIGAIGLLDIGQQSRLWRDKSLTDVAEELLKAVGVGKDTLVWALPAPPPKRKHITQRNESDGAFLARLMAEEGISYVVRNGADRDGDADPPHARIVFFDSNDGYAAVLEHDVLPDRRVVTTEDNSVMDLSPAWQVAPDQTVVRDYDFVRPGFDLTADATASGPGLEVYQHPGRFDDLAPGRERAQRLLERLRHEAQTVSGQSDCPMFEPARTFTLSGHARGDADDKYVLTAVSHQGQLGRAEQGTSYTNHFRGQLASLVHRPPALTTEAPGLQAAFVTGPSGQELHSDEWGRVRVKFPWDRTPVQDDQSSQPLRVGQLPLGGSMVIPRVGFEVLVDHELGELERPVVVGHLYNAKKPPPYELPGGATRSAMQTATLAGGAGANEMRFEDAAGAEEMMFNASYDLVWSVEHDASQDVVANETVTIGGDNKIKIVANEEEKVKVNRTTIVGTQQTITSGANITDAVDGNLDLTVGATRKVTVKGDLREHTLGALSRTVGVLQAVTAIASVTRSIKDDSRTTVGGALAEAITGARALGVDKNYLETVGGLKMIRAKSYAVNAETAYVMNAGSETVRCKGDRTDSSEGLIGMTGGGGISIQAKNINIVAESKLVLRVGGSTIEVTPTKVEMKSAKLELKGAKALASPGSHKTG